MTRRDAGALSTVVLVAACAESSGPRTSTRQFRTELITCQASVGAGTLACAPVQPQAGPHAQPAPGMSFDLTIGGQGVLVRLASSGTAYDSGTQAFTSNVTVENLVAQPMNTADGTTPDTGGIKVFFHSGPTVTGGTGTVSVANADGTGTFTASSQPFFLYSGGAVLASGATTAAKTWEFTVPGTVTRFEFQVFVTTRFPDETDPLIALGLSRTPPVLTVLPGGTGTMTVLLTRTNFTDAVTLSLVGAPPGVTGSFSPPAPTGTSSTLTLNVDGGMTPGVYHLSVDGTGSAGDRSLPFTLTVGMRFGHVFLVTEENHSYSSVIGNAAMPYVNGLAQQYGLATHYYADTHPSIGNYFELATGQIITNNDGSSTIESADNVVRRLVAAGKTWKSYAEGLPSVGFTGDSSGTYVRRHNVFALLSDVVNDPLQLDNLVPFTQFATDLADGTLPEFSNIVPGLCDDAHNCSLATADAWLQTNIDPLIKSATFQQDGLLIITFDEAATSDATDGGGHVVWVAVSPKSKPAYQSVALYQHQSTLRLILTASGVTVYPGDAASAPDMFEFFNPF
ncbi:MAG TPA: alkaline phosphatase family protein [Gemmatimonadales bacterium]|nr:alkaline phosphatase family protein [Gemmatimonadales bacterium]